MRNHRYLVHKVGEHEDPLQTSTAADSMKLWLDEDSDAELSEDKEEEEKSHQASGQTDREEAEGNIRGHMSVQDGRVYENKLLTIVTNEIKRVCHVVFIVLILSLLRLVTESTRSKKDGCLRFYSFADEICESNINYFA